MFKRRTSFDKNLSESNDTNNKVNIKNSNKTIINNKNKRNKSSIFNLIKNRRSTKSEFKNEKLYEEKSSISEKLLKCQHFLPRFSIFCLKSSDEMPRLSFSLAAYISVRTTLSDKASASANSSMNAFVLE